MREIRNEGQPQRTQFGLSWHRVEQFLVQGSAGYTSSPEVKPGDKNVVHTTYLASACGCRKKIARAGLMRRENQMQRSRGLRTARLEA
jgi:hypothetical protein